MKGHTPGNRDHGENWSKGNGSGGNRTRKKVGSIRKLVDKYCFCTTIAARYDEARHGHVVWACKHKRPQKPFEPS